MCQSRSKKGQFSAVDTDLHNENRPGMDEVFERVSLWQTVTAT